MLDAYLLVSNYDNVTAYTARNTISSLTIVVVTVYYMPSTSWEWPRVITISISKHKLAYCYLQVDACKATCSHRFRGFMMA